MKLTVLALTITFAAFTLGACKHHKQAPVATPSATYSTGYGAVK